MEPNMTTGRRLCVGVLTVILFLGFCPAALADTGPDTPRLTQQPDQLVLQLGARWAGVEFELRTDAGIFPVPVVVDASGVLTMDLGGSTTYTLSCIKSTVPIPGPDDAHANEADPEPQPADPEPGGETGEPAAVPRGIPTAQLVVFLAGLLLAIGGLVALYLTKRRRCAQYDWEDEDEEQ